MGGRTLAEPAALSLNAGRVEDAVVFLRLHEASGATIAEAAQAEHATVIRSADARWKRTERKLRRLVAVGFAVRSGAQERGEDSAFGVVRYYAAEHAPTLDHDESGTPE